MGIKLDISVETPLSDDDRDILAGISVMVLAIANRQNLVDQAEASAAASDVPIGGDLTPEDRPCGSQNDAGEFCIREVGHSGWHRYRPVNGMVN